MKKLLGAVAVCIAALSVPSHAAETIINWTDSGAYNEFGAHDPTNTNYIAGFCADCNNGQPGPTFRNFFVFDTSAVQGTVTSAILRLRPGNVGADGVYSVFDVTTPVSTLRAGGTSALGIYDDLGSGVQYGSAAVSTSQTVSRAFVDVVLGGDAIAALNTANGLFAVGGSYSGALQAFGGTISDERRQLILQVSAVPEPSSFALLGAGLALVTAATRRRIAARAATGRG